MSSWLLALSLGREVRFSDLDEYCHITYLREDDAYIASKAMQIGKQDEMTKNRTE